MRMATCWAAKFESMSRYTRQSNPSTRKISTSGGNVNFVIGAPLSLPLSLSLSLIQDQLLPEDQGRIEEAEEVSLQDMMTNEAYAPTQHDHDVFARCVGDFLVKILNKPRSFEAKNTLLPGLRMS